MNKTRFYQLTQSELKLLNDYLMKFENKLLPDMDGHNLGLLIKEIKQQIAINEWNKSQFQTEKRIEELEKELTDLKKLLNKQ
jgi:hypothetical protein